MKAYGQWMQLSAFQCRLTSMKRAELMIEINEILDLGEDSFVIIDLGPAESVEIKVESLGKHAFKAIKPETQVF